eukprot:contig_3484_g747
MVDCPLEYRQDESATNVELTEDADFRVLLAAEDGFVTRIVGDLLARKPELLIMEQGLSDLALHLFVKAIVVVIRRARKADNKQMAKAIGAPLLRTL